MACKYVRKFNDHCGVIAVVRADPFLRVVVSKSYLFFENIIPS